MRFENKVAIEIHVNEQSLALQVPFMLLHTLVENAIQHGSQLESEQNLLSLSITTDTQGLVPGFVRSKNAYTVFTEATTL